MCQNGKGRRWAVPLLMAVWATLTSTVFCEDTSEVVMPQLPSIPSIEELMDVIPERPLNTLADVDAYIRDLSHLADSFLEKTFTAETRRYKRDIIPYFDVTSINVTGTRPHTLKFTNPSEFNATSLERVSGRHVLRTPEKDYWILGYPRSELQSVVSISRPDYRIKLLARFQLQSYSIDKIDKIAAGINLGYLWLALGSTQSSLVSIICINTRTGQWIIPQEITIHGMVGALHMFEANNKLYLVVGERSNLLLDADAELFVLMDNYFDRRDDVHFKVKGVQDIKGFADSESFYYLVLGLESPQGLQVYQFDMLVDTMNLVQVLPESALQVLHFVDQQEEKNYLLTIGDDAFPKIYRWSNQQLRLWQTLPAFDSCCSMGLLTLDNLENIIFIAQGDKIIFYTDDMSGHYFPTFTVRTGCSVIKDMDGMKLGEDYIITYVCKDDHDDGINLQAQSLIFHGLKLVKSETMADDLLQCLDETHALLDGRKPNIEYLINITTSGSIMTMDGPQIWSGLVTFSKGLTVTGTTTFNRVSVKPTGNIVPTPGSLSELLSNINRLKSSVEELAKDLDKVLYHSGTQTITGPITASTLTVDKVDINSLQIKQMNGIPLLDLKNFFMINNLDQTINKSFAVTYMMADSFTTRSHSLPGNINGVLTHEFMQTKVGDQMVDGDHVYSFIISGNIENKEEGNFITINGIDTTTIVTRGSTVTFHDFKIFDGLIIYDSLNVGLINNVNASGLVQRVVYTDVTEQQTLSGKYTLASVQVDGNVDANTINGINLHDLDSAVVKTSGDFSLLGPVTYKESLTVTGSLTATTINGVEWDNLMDLDSPALVTANYYFDDARVVHAIRSNNINGLDFTRDVVLVDTPQTITGHVTFMDDVEVTGAAGVVMEDGGTVNGIDPSQLHVNVDGLLNIVIDEEVYFNAPLKCSGDMVVTTINGLALDDIENHYWRHTLDQEIEVILNVDQAEFHAPVTGLNINGNHILDYLHTSRLQYGSGTYIFKGPVIVEGDLEMEVDKTVDGVDVSELEKNALKLYGEETVEGFINFSGSVIVVGNLVLNGHLNGLNVTSDLMMLDRSFPHTGHIVFREDTVATTITLSNNLVVESLNGLDVIKATSEVVVLTDNATVAGDLQFTGTVDVHSLLVSGSVDEVNINDLAERSLRKSPSTTQVVTGRIVVKDNVHFNQGPFLGVVNSKDWTTHLTNVVLQDYQGTIGGVKTFLYPTHIRRNFDPISINSINVADLAARILTKSTDQIILGHYTFNNSISASDVSVDIIDGISVNDLLLIDEVGSVGGTVTFTKNVTFHGGLNSTTGELDGCDILKANTNAIWKSKNGTTNLHLPVVVDLLTVIGSVTVNGDILAGTSSVVDVMHFLNMLVLRSSDQEISGRVEFLRDVDINNLHVDTIDGVNIDKLYNETVLDNVDMIIKCNLDFTKPLTVGSMTVTRALSGIGIEGVLVNGIDVSDVATRVVLATGGTYIIKGRKTFTNGFHTYHLAVTGSLGGVQMEDLVVLTSSNIIEGISFTNAITIRGNLQVSGLVDGVDLAHLFNSRVTLDQDQTLLGSWTFEAIRVEGDLEADEINDVQISDLVVKFGRKSQEITGNKTIAGGLHVIGGIQTTLLNGLDILDLNRTVVRKDQDAIIKGVVTFENVVRATKSVVVRGTVNGFDLSELNYNLSPLKRIIDEQYLRINRLQSLLDSFAVANFTRIRRFELAYLEKMGFVGMASFGNLWFGKNHNLELHSYLAVRSHGSDCICCNPNTSFFQVNSDGTVSSKATLDLSGAVFILTNPTVNLQITLNRRCTEGVPTNIAVDDITSEPPKNLMTVMSYLDVVIDARMFVDNGLVYIVTLSILHHDFNQTGTVINTLKVDLSLNTVVAVWYNETSYSASTLDLTLIKGILYLLVANHMKADEVNTYRATSQLYLWDSTGRKFQLKGQYLAEHVTSGLFFNSLLPTEETFFALAQLKAAHSPVFENNLKYTTEVLIFRYNEEEKIFEEFECLPAFGVLDQTTLTVDCTLYLLLLSKESLHVYQYYPPEGFRIYQTMKVQNAYALVVVEVSGGTFVVVSVQSPPGVEILKVNIKGVKPYKLLL
ncbi:uncharacterized protein [Panulirus ornatus]|uniref:uncharacterized protein isoform X1 n=1 Tax=Panulirus ornatus TaxID=150431 RepID=UPI003A8583BD